MASTIKTSLITGGMNGIGKETAFSLSRKGTKTTILGQTNDLIFNVYTSLGVKLFAKKPENGAETSIYYLAISPEMNGVFGKYFSNSIAIKSSLLSYDNTIASKLWQTSLKMIAK